MNQEAFFACSDYITGSLSIPELFRNMQKATDFMASTGIGCVHTVSGAGFRGSEAASSAHLTVASAPMMPRFMNCTATRKGVGECFTIRMRR